jgi:hypothetical protein
MYVPPMVRDKLVELGIRQNEPFAICRAERREGNRRFVDWVVQPDGSVAPVLRKYSVRPLKRLKMRGIQAPQRMSEMPLRAMT